tara:strand:+ start:296 stop:541 length:246 start_codon:yes stop_codon:yes gene_type:complete
MMCNLCRESRQKSIPSRIQKILICASCKELEDKLCEIIETEELERYVSFSELIVYCDMLRNDMVAEEKDIPFNEYLSIVRD